MSNGRSQVEEHTSTRRKIQIQVGLVGCVLLLIAGVVGFYAWEIRSGRAALANYEAKLAQHGESLDPSMLQRPPISDADNFASAPLIRESFEHPAPSFEAEIGVLKLLPHDYPRENLDPKHSPFEHLCAFRNHLFLQYADFRASRRIELTGYLRGNSKRTPEQAAAVILKDFEKVASKMAALAEAADRPFANYPMGWEQDVTDRLDRFEGIRIAVAAFQLRAVVHIRAGNSESAFRDSITAIRLSRQLMDTPFLVAALQAEREITRALHPIWEGCLEAIWNADQLSSFETELAQFHLSKRIQKTVRFEKAAITAILREIPEILDLIEKVKDLPQSDGTFRTSAKRKMESMIYLRGSIYRKIVSYNEVLDNFLFENDMPITRVGWHHVEKFALERDILERTNKTKNDAAIFTPVDCRNSLIRGFKGDAMIQNARIACALERYRLNEGTYPDNLAALKPDYLAEIPIDNVTGTGLKYFIREDGRPAIYAVGSDQLDDGGYPRNDVSKGDWVWQYSTPDGYQLEDFQEFLFYYYVEATP